MLSGSMQLLHALTILCSLCEFPTLVSAENTNSSVDLEFKVTEISPPLPANLILQRNAAITSKLAAGPAIGVKKMSDDEGEKFFLDYWGFGDDFSSGNISERNLSDDDGFSPVSFVAQSYPFGPSYSLGTDSESEVLPRENSNSVINLFEKRDFKCPAGTTACVSIGRSDRCCGSGETCQIVADTGHGNVGCCPRWKNCSGMIGSCQSGYTACSQALGGGCCIPGYDCVEGGCEWIPFFPFLFPILSSGIGSMGAFTNCSTRCIHHCYYGVCSFDRGVVYCDLLDQTTGYYSHFHFLLFFDNLSPQQQVHNKRWLGTASTTYEPTNSNQCYPRQRCLPNWFLRLLGRLPRWLLPHRKRL